MTTIRKISTILTLVFFTFTALLAQPGTLDASFGTGGKVLHSIGQKDDWAWCAALQPDGKIVAAGYSTVGFVQQQAVSRFLANGSPDPSFGTSGNYVSTTEREVLDVALQADGKIVTCGFQYNSNFYGGFAVSRLQANGTADASFGTNGSVRHAFGTVTEKAQTVAVQADGKIVAAGFVESGNNNYNFALIRLNADGTLDPAFGTGGKVTTQVGTGHDMIHDMRVLSDGKILVCGSSWNSSNQDRIALARYNANGTLDNTFGTDGIYIGQNGEGIKLLLASNGQILLAGRQVGTTVPDAYLWRFSANGVLDNSFGTNGLASVQDIYLSGAALQTDGKILLTGLKFSDFATARLSADGVLDAAFGTAGVVVTNVPQLQQIDQGHEVLVQTDGKIVVVGESYQGTKHNMSLVRYHAEEGTEPPTGLKGLQFDGNDFVNLPASVGQALGSSNFTVEAWIKGNESELPTHGAILSNRNGLNAGLYFGIHDQWNGSAHKMLVFRYNGNNLLHINNGTFNAEILDGTCHHVAVSRNGTTLSFYIDGALIGSNTVASGFNLSTTAPMRIGNDDYSDLGFKGSIADVRIWAVARTTAQIQAGMQGVAPTTAGLIGNWILNEGSGQAILDNTQANPGTLGASDAAEAADPTWVDGSCAQIVGTENPDNILAFNGLRIFPNPVSDAGTLNIMLENDFVGPIRFEIFSLNGQRLGFLEGEKTTSGQVFEWKNLPGTGPFFLRVSDGKTAVTRVVLRY